MKPNTKNKVRILRQEAWKKARLKEWNGHTRQDTRSKANTHRPQLSSKSDGVSDRESVRVLSSKPKRPAEAHSSITEKMAELVALEIKRKGYTEGYQQALADVEKEIYKIKDWRGFAPNIVVRKLHWLKEQHD